MTIVTVEDRDTVRILTLNRPDRLNAFTNSTYDALVDALEAANVDDAVRIVVLTGAGRAFSAGADLKDLSDPELAPKFEPAFHRMLDVLDEFPKPVIAAVNGLAVGIGTTILLHCDLVLADEQARFRTPFPQLSTTPEAGSSLLLPRLIGPQFAKWMLLTGEWVDAATAARFGLVAEVCPAGTVVGRALDIASRMAELPLEALAAAKRLVDDGLADAVRAARQRESAAVRTLPASGLGGSL